MSCSKKDDDNGGDTPAPPASFKGSVTITINGTTYNDLLMDVIESTDEDDGLKDVACLLKGGFSNGSPDFSGNNFALAITNIPEVGQTVTLNNNPLEEETSLIIVGSPVEGYQYYIGATGSITRVSADKYTIDGTLNNVPNMDTEFTISGTIEVGVHQ
ncbi:MAG: hypothetical protein B7C24_09560 [Bacteroidetes bacterium 4572_77]|nr:MAG: hypothetical protein B7C24_09560 [Bacteroidetes bacterium 4572_77]